MKRLVIPAALAIAALVLAACGSDGSGDSSSSSTPVAAGSATVSIASVEGAGDVLVDSSGMALYAADEEADGTVRCVDACEAFWIPLEAGGSAPTAGDGVPSLGVVARPDGTQQVALGGRPLYTFSQDSPGNVTGDGFADDFDGQRFTWHVVHSDGTTAVAPAGTTPTTPGGYGGGYGY